MFSLESLKTNLLELGVRKIFFCAGARNAPLLGTLKETFEMDYCLDERSAAFKALGYAKKEHVPTVVCTTSGTAVSECFPAMIEAFYSEVPLIMISADRPERLRNTRAPQAIDQINIFGKYANQFINLVDDHKEFELEKLYPLHINVEVDDREVGPEVLRPPDFVDHFMSAKKVLVVLTEGDTGHPEEVQYLNELNCHFYVECTSHYKNFQFKSKIQYEQELLEEMELAPFDCIIKFGRTPICKLWRLLDTKYYNIPTYNVADKMGGISHGVYLESIERIRSQVMDSMLQYRKRDLERVCKLHPKSEASVFNQIFKRLKNDEIVFVGNSMPIRYAQLVDKTHNKIFASRGANGIDGQISTAIGMAQSSREHIHCIVGDLTALYDYCVLMEPLPENISVHIINNSGGRIFEQVNTPKEIILTHEMILKNNIHPNNQDKVYEYFPDNQETKKFWSEWKK